MCHLFLKHKSESFYSLGKKTQLVSLITDNNLEIFTNLGFNSNL